MRFWIAALLLVSIIATAQTPRPSHVPVPEASSADVKSIDSILAALYDVISGPVGKKRDWNRFHSLFWPGARLIPTGRRPYSSESFIRVLTPKDYVTNTARYLKKEGFFEREIARHVDQYGNIAQVFSTYESRHKAEEAPFTRGINSIQLVNDGQRWWIVTILWQRTPPESPIPAEYLPARKP
jgi:hypothetical protein